MNDTEGEKLPNNVFIRPLADIHSSCLGARTKNCQFCVVLKDAQIGQNTNICSRCFVGYDVQVDNYFIIKNCICIYEGVRLKGSFFIGPNDTFTDDKAPRAKHYLIEYLKRLLKRCFYWRGACCFPALR